MPLLIAARSMPEGRLSAMPLHGPIGIGGWSLAPRWIATDTKAAETVSRGLAHPRGMLDPCEESGAFMADGSSASSVNEYG